MELVERYLRTVRILLPASQREDITAELRDALLTLREERETELNRPLTLDEQEDLLREVGHPVIVAGRYRRQQYLIGPDLYPLYRFALLLVLAIVLGSSVLAGIVTAVAGEPSGVVIGRTIGIAWNGVFVTIGAITFVFATLQRYVPGRDFLRNWRPRDLPDVPKARLTRWFEHVAAIVITLIFIFWWTNVLNVPPVLPLDGGQNVRLQLAPIWQDLFWPVFLFAAGTLAAHGLRLLTKTPGRVGHAVDVILQLILLAIAIAALRAGHWVDISGVGLSPDAMVKVDRGVNTGVHISLFVCIVIAMILGGISIRRLVRRDA